VCAVGTERLENGITPGSFSDVGIKVVYPRTPGGIDAVATIPAPHLPLGAPDHVYGWKLGALLHRLSIVAYDFPVDIYSGLDELNVLYRDRVPGFGHTGLLVSSVRLIIYLINSIVHQKHSVSRPISSTPWTKLVMYTHPESIAVTLSVWYRGIGRNPLTQRYTRVGLGKEEQQEDTQ
jgi:hypothetical protein